MAIGNTRLSVVGHELRRRFSNLQVCASALEVDCERKDCLRWLEAIVDAASECEGAAAQLEQLPTHLSDVREAAPRRRRRN